MKISNFPTKRVHDWTVQLKPIYKDYSIYGIVKIKLEQSHQKMKSGQMTLWFENFTTNCVNTITANPNWIKNCGGCSKKF